MIWYGYSNDTCLGIVVILFKCQSITYCWTGKTAVPMMPNGTRSSCQQTPTDRFVLLDMFVYIPSGVHYHGPRKLPVNTSNTGDENVPVPGVSTNIRCTYVVSHKIITRGIAWYHFAYTMTSFYTDNLSTAVVRSLIAPPRCRVLTTYKKHVRRCAHSVLFASAFGSRARVYVSAFFAGSIDGSCEISMSALDTRFAWSWTQRQ